MDVIIRGRDGQVPERLKEFANLKLQRLGRFLSTITTVDIELYEDGSRVHVAELTVATSGPVFRSKGAASDPRASIDMAVDRVERRLKEFKRRRSGRPAHSRPRVPAADMSTEDAEEGYISDLGGLDVDTGIPTESKEGNGGDGGRGDTSD